MLDTALQWPLQAGSDNAFLAKLLTSQNAIALRRFLLDIRAQNSYKAGSKASAGFGVPR